MAQGIIFGNVVLSEEEFEEIFYEWYEVHSSQFQMELQNSIITPIKSMIYQGQRWSASQNKNVKAWYRTQEYDAKQIMTNWERITSNYFGNMTVDLLASVKFEGQQMQWTKVMAETDVTDKVGINITPKGLDTIKGATNTISMAFAAEAVQNTLNNHYEDMMRSISAPISSEQASHMHAIVAMRNAKSNLHKYVEANKSLYDIIYGAQGNAEGKALDAYMNHVGNIHSGLFKLMKGGAVSNAEALANSLGDFRGRAEFDDMNFEAKANWLLDSLNTTPWFSGGDIVVVDQNGSVIYNIQLKSTGSGKSFELAMSALLTFANRVNALISSNKKNSAKQLAKYMFKRLKIDTANDFERTEEFYRENVLKMVRERLKLNQSIHMQF